MAFNFPSLEIAVDDLNQIYGNRIRFELKQISDPSLKDCLRLSDEAAYLMSRFYYARNINNNNNSDLVVIIDPGKAKQRYRYD